MIVIDSSALVEALIRGDTTGKAIRARMAAEDRIHAPTLIDYEVTAVLFNLTRAEKLSLATTAAALGLLPRLPIERHAVAPALWRRMHKLYSNLSAYDAAYVALAEHLGPVPLVTCDGRISRAGVARCQVEVHAAHN
jgi:predicted nucleic acid-binding protein